MPIQSNKREWVLYAMGEQGPKWIPPAGIKIPNRFQRRMLRWILGVVWEKEPRPPINMFGSKKEEPTEEPSEE